MVMVELENIENIPVVVVMPAANTITEYYLINFIQDISEKRE
jgi:hypothetical protein